MSGRLGMAKAALEKALQIQRQLSQDRPGEIAFSIDLAMTCGEMGVVLRESGQLQAALQWYGQNIATLEAVLRKQPQHVEARRYQSATYMARAETLVRLNRRPEAILDWQKMVELGENQSHSELRCFRAGGLAQLGEHVRAVSEVKAMEATGREPAYSLYNFVCVYSLSARAAFNDSRLSSPERSRLAEEYGGYAVALLARMRSAGFFKDQGVLDYLKKDTDMEPLRERADFQKLKRELEQEIGATRK